MANTSQSGNQRNAGDQRKRGGAASGMPRHDEKRAATSSQSHGASQGQTHGQGGSMRHGSSNRKS